MKYADARWESFEGAALGTGRGAHAKRGEAAEKVMREAESSAAASFVLADKYPTILKISDKDPLEEKRRRIEEALRCIETEGLQDDLRAARERLGVGASIVRMQKLERFRQKVIYTECKSGRWKGPEDFATEKLAKSLVGDAKRLMGTFGIEPDKKASSHATG